MIHLFSMLHFAGDTALWMVWGGLVLGFFTPVSNLFITVPILGISGMAADWLAEKRKWLGWLGLIPALGIFPFCETVGDRLLAAPAFLYLGACILRGATQPDATEAFYRFRSGAAAAVAGGLLCVFAGRVWGFQCAMVTLAAQVFLSRMLRHTREELRNPRLMALELALLAAIGLLCLMLSTDLMLKLGLLTIKWIYKLLLYPALMAILYCFMAVIYALGWVFSRFFNGSLDIMPQQTFGEAMEAVGFVEPDTGGGNPWLVLILKILGAALFLAAAWLLFRYLRSGGGKWKAEEGSEDEIRAAADFPEEEPDARRGILDRSPEARIRRAYAGYCRALSRRGTAIAPADTTRSINRNASLETDPDAAELRRLYLLARYRTASGVTQNDAKKAQLLAKQLRAKI